MEVTRFKPTRADVLAAVDKRLTDILAGGLDVLFCGTNPGLYSAAIGRHFGRPGNRFWPALFAGGFTPRLYSPWEDESILDLGLGLTNIRERATAGAAELGEAELKAASLRLIAKVERHRPRYLGVIGIGAYRTAVRRPKATFGLQTETIGTTRIWLLPSTSGLNASYQPSSLALHFGEFHREVYGKGVNSDTGKRRSIRTDNHD